jgi:hypothetical protein
LAMPERTRGIRIAMEHDEHRAGNVARQWAHDLFDGEERPPIRR